MSIDDDLDALERALRQNPSDEELRRHWERALRRAGETERLREVYRFEFQCPMRWEDMAPMEEAGVRHCGQCERAVFFVRDLEALRRHVRRGDCVSVVRSLIDTCFDTLARDEDMSKAPGDSCIVPRDSLPPEAERTAVAGEVLVCESTVRGRVTRPSMATGPVSDRASSIDRLGEMISELCRECHGRDWIDGAEYLVPALVRRYLERSVAAGGRPLRWGAGKLTNDRAWELESHAVRIRTWARPASGLVRFEAFDPFPLPVHWQQRLERQLGAVALTPRTRATRRPTPGARVSVSRSGAGETVIECPRRPK